MLLKTRDGIRCDSCKIELKSSFSYYSADFRKISVFGGVIPQINYVDDIYASLDLCSECYSKVVDNIRKYYKPTRKGMYCESCGKHFDGDFTFFHCVIDRVKVEIKSSTPTSTSPKIVEPWLCCECMSHMIEKSKGDNQWQSDQPKT